MCVRVQVVHLIPCSTPQDVMMYASMIMYAMENWCLLCQILLRNACMSCLESSNPSSCQEHWECQDGEHCQRSNVGHCKICIYKIYFAMMRCVGISGAQQLTNCILNKVYSHCKSCVCWATCKSGLKNVCNCCRRGQCSESRIYSHLQNILASGRKGEI